MEGGREGEREREGERKGKGGREKGKAITYAFLGLHF